MQHCVVECNAETIEWSSAQATTFNGSFVTQDWWNAIRPIGVAKGGQRGYAPQNFEKYSHFVVRGVFLNKIVLFA